MLEYDGVPEMIIRNQWGFYKIHAISDSPLHSYIIICFIDIDL